MVDWFLFLIKYNINFFFFLETENMGSFIINIILIWLLLFFNKCAGYISKRIKLNKNLTKKRVGMGYGDMCVKKWRNNKWRNNI